MPYADRKSPAALATQKRARDKWRLMNPEKLAAWRAANAARIQRYQDKIKARREASRPKPACKCGNTSHFRWLKGTWQCLDCSKKASHALELERDRLKRIEVEVRKILTRHGEKAARSYRDYLEGGRYRPRLRDLGIHNLLLPRDYQKLSDKEKERIFTLNVLCKLPIGNIGWTCQKCATYCGDHRFFDIDHILPRHKKGGSRRNNLQVLCPNCHRKKTLIDVWDRTLASMELNTHRAVQLPEPVRSSSVPATVAAAEPGQQHATSGLNHNDHDRP